MRSIPAGALALGAVLSCSTAQALEPWVLYDDFAAPLLDKGKWPDTALERRREQTGGLLRLVQRDTGLNTQDTGRNGASWSHSVSRGTPVRQLRAAVRVNAVSAIGCSSPSTNTTPTLVRARLLGTFFSTGNRVPGNNVGDVLAQIYLFRDSASSDPVGTLRIEARLNLCQDSTCNAASPIGSTVSLGTATVGQNVLLTMEWDPSVRSFRFSRDNGATWASVAYDGAGLSLDDRAEPGNLFKSVGLRTDVANCSGGPRAEGYIDAQFDNVAVNRSAAP